MKLCYLPLLLLSLQSVAQDVTVIQSPQPAIDIPNVGLTSDTIDVSLASSYGIKSVMLHFQHDGYPMQLSVSLSHDGGTVALFYQGTFEFTGIYDVECNFSMLHRSIVLSEPPYSGEFYSPVQNLGEFNTGDPTGEWVLTVEDHLGSANGGSLISWGLTFGEDSLFLPSSPQYSDPSSPMPFCSSEFTTGCSQDQGSYQDSLSLDLGCVSSEVSSSWMEFFIQSSGNIAFTVHSATNYDFTLWEVDNLGMWNVIQCDSTDDGGKTGLGTFSTIDSLFFQDPVYAYAGQHYMLLLDNKGYFDGSYDGSEMPFYLEWTGDATTCNISTQVAYVQQAQAMAVAMGDGMIRLSLNETSAVEVFDMAGKLIMRNSYSSGVHDVNLQSGRMYFVVVSGRATKVFAH